VCHGQEFLQTNIRVHSGLEPLGVLGDLGWYCVRFILWSMNEKMPDRIRARVLSEFGRRDSAGSVPTEFSAELIYPDGVSAQFYCSFLTELQQWVHLSGTRGYLSVPDFVLPYYGSELAFEVNQAVYHIAGCDFNMQNHTRRHAVAEYSNSMANAQETRMVARFAELAMSGKPDFSWGESTLKTQKLLDDCLDAARSDMGP
jgi:predicted dehydrogenase